jgi:calcineurin-like phosphoesterase family protein/gag-polyprotein putative aspartyl protease
LKQDKDYIYRQKTNTMLSTRRHSLARLFTILLCCLCGFPRLAKASAEAVAPSIQEEAIPFTQDGDGHILIKAMINGVEGNFMFDTGAGVNVVTKHFFDKLQHVIPDDGFYTGFRATGDRIDSKIYHAEELTIGKNHFPPGPLAYVPAQSPAGKPASISGYVFLDSNHNGIKDDNEQGIKGVAVSDQVNVVITDDKGYYQINDPAGYGIIFISMPDGFAAAHGFWQKLEAPATGPSAPASINFPLSKATAHTSFTFIHASDTHVSEKTLDRMQKFRNIVDSVKPDFVIITGDLVKDALRVPETEARGLFELFTREIGKMTTPVWLIPGNHENFGIERHLSLVSPQNPLYGRKMYRYYFGPDYYSFNYGGFHFIGLNSLSFDDLYYYGHIDSTQVEWLKRDIAAIPLSMPIITFQHVPFFSGVLSMEPLKLNGFDRTVEWENGVLQYRHVVSNAQEVYAILSQHNYPLALAGHHHLQQKFIMEGIQTRFEQTAAVIGPGDLGVFKNPSGVTVYHASNGVIDGGHFVRLDK